MPRRSSTSRFRRIRLPIIFDCSASIATFTAISGVLRSMPAHVRDTKIKVSPLESIPERSPGEGIQDRQTWSIWFAAGAWRLSNCELRSGQPRGEPSPAYIDDFVASAEGLRLAEVFFHLPPAGRRRLVV